MSFREGAGITVGCWSKSRKAWARGFPGGLVVKNPPANAGDMGLTPDPCATEWLSLVPQLLSMCSRAWELQLLSPQAATTEHCEPRTCALQKHPPQWKAHAPESESSPCSQKLGKVHMQQWRPNAAKNLRISIFFNGKLMPWVKLFQPSHGGWVSLKSQRGEMI